MAEGQGALSASGIVSLELKPQSLNPQALNPKPLTSKPQAPRNPKPCPLFKRANFTTRSLHASGLSLARYQVDANAVQLRTWGQGLSN